MGVAEMLKKICSFILTVPAVLFVAWIALSWFDIAMDNNGAAVHSAYNLFTLLCAM
jgi:hypothetical protein